MMVFHTVTPLGYCNKSGTALHPPNLSQCSRDPWNYSGVKDREHIILSQKKLTLFRRCLLSVTRSRFALVITRHVHVCVMHSHVHIHTCPSKSQMVLYFRFIVLHCLVHPVMGSCTMLLFGTITTTVYLTTCVKVNK